MTTIVFDPTEALARALGADVVVEDDDDAGETMWRTLVALQNARSSNARRIVVVLPSIGIAGAARAVEYTAAIEGIRAMARSAARQWASEGHRGQHGGRSVVSVREWAPVGITVYVISPLAYSPAMTAAIEVEPAMEERLSRRVPVGRIGDPERDIGSAVAFLVGPAARYITGQTLGVDGGHFTSP